MSQIECKDVSVKYENQVVLEDISFSIEQGDYLCIVGENGSGKSTLVKTILGLENSKLGQIVFGEGLNKNEIGYLPQQTQAQKDFPASVYEVVLSGCLNSKGFSPFYSMKDKKLANEMIKLDEPITGLDPTVTREMYSLIKEINKKGITIIMVSHDINFAVNNASKILHLKKNIKFFGNTEDYANSEVGRRFIGGAQID